MRNQLTALPQAVVIGTTPPILVSYGPSQVYKDGKPTGTFDGTRVTVVAPGQDFASISVKVPADGVALDSLTNEAISAANAAGNYPRVSFDGFTAKAYVGRDGNLGITATAARVFLVDANGKPKGPAAPKEA